MRFDDSYDPERDLASDADPFELERAMGDAERLMTLAQRDLIDWDDLLSVLAELVLRIEDADPVRARRFAS